MKDITIGVCWLVLVVALKTVSPMPPQTSSQDLEQTETQKTDLRNSFRTRTRQGRLASSQSKAAVEPFESERGKNVTQYLNSLGYFRKGQQPLQVQTAPETDTGSSSEVSDPNKDAVRMFQSFFGLRQTGELDSSTMALMERNRCGVADIDEEKTDPSAPSKFTLTGTKWENKNYLTWKLFTPTYKVSRGDQLEAFRNAVDVWAKVTPLDFIEVQDESKVDIEIQFVRGRHNDNSPFDGPSKVLAHAFGPGAHGLPGDVHFDDDEKWVVQGQDGTDLFVVAAHELGHSLGLSHSRDPDALMYPYYGTAVNLGRDDIQGIQQLYGVRISATRTPRPTSRPPVTMRPTTKGPLPTTRSPVSVTTPSITTPSSECSVQFDEVLQDDWDSNKVYTGIKDNQVFRFTEDGLLPAFPQPLNNIYPGAPERPDAVFHIPETRKTYFLRDSKLWVYSNNLLEKDYPKLLNRSHFPEATRFVLSLMDAGGNRRVFVFGSTYWLEYNFDRPSERAPQYYSIPQYWPGVRADVIFAVTGVDGYIYLISRDRHVILDRFRRPKSGGGSPGQPNWMHRVCFQMALYASANGANQNDVSGVRVITVFLLGISLYVI